MLALLVACWPRLAVGKLVSWSAIPKLGGVIAINRKGCDKREDNNDSDKGKENISSKWALAGMT